MRVLLSVLLSVLMWAPLVAQEEETAWRATVTGQISALRGGDGEAALSYAGAAFRANYQANPQQFVDDIARSGYGPIGESRSHTFGAFRELAPGAVLQEVEFVDMDGRVWEAIYQLVDERDEGWRIQGVVLRSTEGLGI
jgi:sensor domain CHASE-containing protein